MESRAAPFPMVRLMDGKTSCRNQQSNGRAQGFRLRAVSSWSPGSDKIVVS
jgi:hypothetical protein